MPTNVALVLALTTEVEKGMRIAGMPEPVRGTNGYEAEHQLIDNVVLQMLGTAEYVTASIDLPVARRLVAAAVARIAG